MMRWPMLLISALSGQSLLAEMKITRSMFDAMPKAVSGKGTGNRYQYKPFAGPYPETQAIARRKRQIDAGKLQVSR